MNILELLNTYSGVLNLVVSFIMAIITLVYVVFTYKQAQAAQNALKTTIKQIKVEKQPCVVYENVKGVGSDCFGNGRRQLHIQLELENIGNSPAMSVYVFSYLELQHIKSESNIVNMYYLPDFVSFIKENSKVEVSTRFEEDEINLLLEDLSIASAKNIQRIKDDPTRFPYLGTTLVIEIYYKDILGQWFKNVKHISIAEIEENNKRGKGKVISPANLLKDNVWFGLRFIAPQFSKNSIEMVEEAEIKEKLKLYEIERPFVETKDYI